MNTAQNDKVMETSQPLSTSRDRVPSWRKTSRVFGWIGTHLALILVTAFFILPFLWVVGTSFKPPRDYYRTPALLWPEHPVLVFNYQAAFAPQTVNWKRALDESEVGSSSYFVNFAPPAKDAITSKLINSLIVAPLAVLLSLLIGSTTAYALSRFRFKGSSKLGLWLLSARMMPPMIMVIPFFMLFIWFGWIDTYHGLILVYGMFNLPFVVWMMKGVYDDIPVDLEEQAMVDGCNRWQAFWRIVLPLSVGGIAATALFIYFLTWNEFTFALILTRGRVMTLPVALAGFIGEKGILWGSMSAAVVVASVPVLILTFFMQKQIVRGLTAGALK
jgi:multiple sugar transport system permease protein